MQHQESNFSRAEWKPLVYATGGDVRLYFIVTDLRKPSVAFRGGVILVTLQLNSVAILKFDLAYG
jgi:hypothetical protein